MNNGEVVWLGFQLLVMVVESLSKRWKERKQKENETRVDVYRRLEWYNISMWCVSLEIRAERKLVQEDDYP